MLMGLAFVFLVFSALAFVSGLMTYLKFRSYQMYGKRTTYETVRNWCLVFTIMTIISSGAIIPFYIYRASVLGKALTDVLIDYFLRYLEVTANIFIGRCGYCAILSLKE